MRSTVRWTRRQFAGAVGASAWLCTVVPRHTVARSAETPPSEKINVAGIGVGGMGHGDINAVAGLGTNIVALCDVDLRRAGGTFKQFPQAKQYRDFRKMLDEMDRQIDAVVVATPDHAHAVAAMAAIKRRKHVYCEKPLAHSVYECRALVKAAQEKNV
ncbi:MAG TPA: Gfo/Idh/MocA family oxidoreductase, partial [Thermoguttaceae bacterium]|nr:Gfo/Idh/MocA family oxidoreductase [Thermoguttaceae bacterium]